MVLPTSNQIRGWLFLVFHSPLSGLWLLQVIVAVAGIARGIFHPGELLAAGAVLGTLGGATGLIAKAKGIDAWPPSPRDLPPTPTPRTLPPE